MGNYYSRKEFYLDEEVDFMKDRNFIKNMKSINPNCINNTITGLNKQISWIEKELKK